MSTRTNRHKTEEINRIQDPSTRSIVQPFARFKKPNKNTAEDVELTYVRFLLPEDDFVDIPAGSYIVVGRQEGNDRDVHFDLGILYGSQCGVSRTHAVIQITDACVFIRDFDSTNGTYLNGSELYPLRDYQLCDGDVLKLGKVQMQVIFIAQKTQE
jgi:pSer/pThr/pTyr-binding forkhead associated (FHA) protein